MLSGCGDNTMLEYLKKSYLEGVKSKTKPKLYFIKKQQLLILAQMGECLLFLWFAVPFLYLCLEKITK